MEDDLIIGIDVNESVNVYGEMMEDDFKFLNKIGFIKDRGDHFAKQNICLDCGIFYWYLYFKNDSHLCQRITKGNLRYEFMTNLKKLRDNSLKRLELMLNEIEEVNYYLEQN